MLKKEKNKEKIEEEEEDEEEGEEEDGKKKAMYSEQNDKDSASFQEIRIKSHGHAKPFVFAFR